MTIPAIIAANRIPVPVAENRLSRNSAFSGAAAGGATGGTRCTRLCRLGTGSFGAAILSSAAFTCGVPHTSSSAVRIAHGIQAWSGEHGGFSLAPGWVLIVAIGTAHLSFGFQNRNSSTVV